MWTWSSNVPINVRGRAQPRRTAGRLSCRSFGVARATRAGYSVGGRPRTPFQGPGRAPPADRLRRSRHAEGGGTVLTTWVCPWWAVLVVRGEWEAARRRRARRLNEGAARREVAEQRANAQPFDLRPPLTPIIGTVESTQPSIRGHPGKHPYDRNRAEHDGTRLPHVEC